MVPATVKKTLPLPTENDIYWRISRIDITFLNLLKAAYLGGDDSIGPYREGGPPTAISKSPKDWYCWSYILMHPSAQQWYTQTTTHITATQAQQLFMNYSLFKHVKTTMNVMATQNATGWDPVASLLIQDNYWGDSSHGDRYATFMQLTAHGAPWAFPPQQRSVSRRSFNHHTMSGTNDPSGETWKILNPRPGETSQVDWNFGSLFLAASTEVVDRTAAGTAKLQMGSPNTWIIWAAIRIKSKFLLGNQKQQQRLGLNYATGNSREHDMQL